jgi:hypothetical protein
MVTNAKVGSGVLPPSTRCLGLIVAHSASDHQALLNLCGFPLAPDCGPAAEASPSRLFDADHDPSILAASLFRVAPGDGAARSNPLCRTLSPRNPALPGSRKPVVSALQKTPIALIPRAPLSALMPFHRHPPCQEVTPCATPHLADPWMTPIRRNRAGRSHDATHHPAVCLISS